MITSSAFDFRRPSGYQLSGRLEVPGESVHAWTLFAHCFTCGKDNLAAVRIARGLAEHGIGTLRFDLAGLGKSGGKFGAEGFGADVANLVAAGRAMESAGRPPDLLVGHSLGGAAALAAAADLRTVKAVTTIGTPFDVQHVLKQFDPASLTKIEADGEADVQFARRPFHIHKSSVEDLRRHDQGARIAALRRPLLILQNAFRTFRAARHPKSFISLEGADHLLTEDRDTCYVANLIAAWPSRYVAPRTVTIA